MSTYDSAALWSATSLALDERKIGAAGLSVRHRKLLGLLAEPASVPQLAQLIALPDADVHAALQRFAKLGFATSDELAPAPPPPMRDALRSVSPATDVATAPTRVPLFAGLGVAALVAIATTVWLTQGGAPGTANRTASSTENSAVAPGATAGAATARPSDLPGAAAPASPQALPAASQAATARAGAVGSAAATLTPAAQAQAAAARAASARAAEAAAAAAVAAAAARQAALVAPAAAAVPTTASLLVPVAPAPVAPAATSTTLPPASPATTVVAPPAAAPPIATSAPPNPAPTALAAAAPRPAPAAAREIRLVNRVEPAFPRGYDADKGSVRARLQVNAQGTVTGVDIVEASPPRVFDRTVRTALQQWRYEATGEPFSVMAEISFAR